MIDKAARVVDEWASELSVPKIGASHVTWSCETPVYYDEKHL